ncbi:MAG: S1C family serine protease [Planctomycetota bacterium]
MRRWLLTLVVVAAAVAARGGELRKSVLRRVTSSCALVQAVQGRKAEAGSGFFVGRSEVLTNYHVIKGAIDGDAQVVVVVDSARKSREVVEAAIIGADEDLDLALLRVEHRSSSYLRFLRDRQLRVTEEVWVAGYPFGTQPGLEVTVTAGTISSLRKDEEGDLRQVQIDASINPGNSGGPVVDDRGGVVGVTRAVVSPRVGAGMAIAIPCGAAEDFVSEAKRFRRRSRAVRLLGKTSRHGFRITEAEKVAEPWGASVRLELRGDRDAEEAETFTAEIVDRRRNVLKAQDIVPTGLEHRKTRAFTIRLKGVDYNDIAYCRVAD